MFRRDPAFGRAPLARPRGTPDLYPVAVWLLGVAALVFAMVVIGGITRLTESGLSIVAWAPFTGILPPLSDAAWDELFRAYQRYPEFKTLNRLMDLDGFKTIFWWEYIHRLWGRLIAVAFLLPYLWFLATGALRGRLAWRTGAAFILGGLQGVLGWFMVKSGLVADPDVSAYRLAAHLGLALVIYVYLLWLAFDILADRKAGIGEPAPTAWVRRLALALLVMIALTMVSGAFVAGLDAGLAYNTFPLMDGRLVPPDLLMLDPLWRNAFENVIAVQFTHRVLAVATLATAAALVLAVDRAPRRGFWATGANVAALLVALQVALGIATLLLYVPVPLGALHQANAVLALSAALWTWHRLRRAGRGAAREDGL